MNQFDRIDEARGWLLMPTPEGKEIGNFIFSGRVYGKLLRCSGVFAL